MGRCSKFIKIQKEYTNGDLDEGYNVVTSYKKNTCKQSVKINRDVVEYTFERKKKVAIIMHLVLTAVNLEEDQSWSQTLTKVCLQRRLAFPLMVKLAL